MAKTTNPKSIFYGDALVNSYDDARKSFAVDIEGNVYKHISESSTTVVSNASGVLHGITVNTAAAGAITIYDGTTTGGTVIGIIKASAAEGFYEYDVAYSTGLTIQTAHADLDITVSYRPAAGTISSVSASRSASPSLSPSESASPSSSASPSASLSPSRSASPSSSPSASASPSASPSLSPSASLSPSPSLSPSRSGSPSSSPSASISPSWG